MSIDITGNVVTQVLERFNKSAMDKRLLVENILLNQKYIRGKQNGYFEIKSAYAQEFLEDSEDDLKETFNKMLPIFTKRLQILTRNQPNVRVKPISNQLEIDKKTKLTNAYIDKVKRDNTFNEKYFSLIKKLETYSMGFYKIIFDNKMGTLEKIQLKKQLSNKKSIKKMSDEDISLVVKMIKSGAINLYVGDTREFYVADLHSSKLSDNEYIMHAKAYHVDDIESAFGVEVSAENISSITQQDQNRGYSAERYNSDSLTPVSLDDHAMVIEYYERPSHNVPNGRKIIIAGNKLIDTADLPYRCGPNGEFAYNFVCIPQIPQEGFFYGENIYTQLRPVQRRYNVNRNLVIQGIKKAIMGGLLVPDDALEDNEIFTNELGLIINYASLSGEPKELKMGGVITDVWHEIAQSEKEFIDISGVTPVSTQTSANIRSSKQMDKMSQNDEASVGVTASSINRGHIELFEKVLRITRERTKVLPIEIFENGMDKLILTADNILDSIYVANAGIIGLTEQQQKNQIFEVATLGVLNTEGQNVFGAEHVKIILEESGLGHIIPQLDSDAKHQEEYVNRENNELAFSTEQKNINDFDDDTIHIKYHERMLMSSEFNSKILTGKNGEKIKNMIDDHVNQHRKRLAKAQELNQLFASMKK